MVAVKCKETAKKEEVKCKETAKKEEVKWRMQAHRRQIQTLEPMMVNSLCRRPHH
jgi:hypothetical protein